MSTEQYVHYRDTAVHDMIGLYGIIGLQNAGGSVSFLTDWHPGISRFGERVFATGAAGDGQNLFEGETPDFHPSGLFLPHPPSRSIIRMRNNIGMEYVSGSLTSRINWGLMNNHNASSAIVNTLSGLGEPGHIGFQWIQIGAVAANIFAIVSENTSATVGTTIIFSQDTGVVGAAGGTGPTVHSLRIDLDPTAGEIRFYIADVLVATFTPTTGQFNNTVAPGSVKLGTGIYAGNPNQCRMYHRIGGVGGMVSVVSPGAG